MQSKFFTLLAVAAIGAVSFAGCSKPADTSSSSSTDTSAASSASAAPAAAAASSEPAAASSAASSTTASAGDATKGETIFSANCASCHGAKGAGGGVGPSLKGEKSRKDTDAAVAWIKNPQPPMPKLYPSPLSEKDVADVAAYVESL
ncbi:MAG: c-type cytochrome [Candidatus Velthaea sp.]|jgi:mono/diheme cytochrome c family protein